MPVVDASVVVALFRQDDPNHAPVTAWLRAMLRSGQPITAPTVLLAEVGAAIRRSTGSAALGQAIVGEVEAMPGLTLVPVSPELGRRSAAIAALHALRGCDAVYVATAEHLGDALVTLDDEQLSLGAAVVSTLRPS